MVDAPDRRRRAALAGHTGDAAAARALLDDADPAVRATALGALGRLVQAGPEEVTAALADPIPAVRRRACQVAIGVAGVELLPLLADPDAGVVETAAWALGERAEARADVVAALARVSTGHDDALCREAAVAALGAIGDEGGLPAILAATRDRPAVRRRAVIALAPFAGPQVEAALTAALEDRDWQVRQAAEDLASEDRASEDRASEDRASEDRASDDLASEDRAGDDLASEDRAGGQDLPLGPHEEDLQ